MAFQLSPQQIALKNWAKNGQGNAFVEAVAGSGKTTSLIEVIKDIADGQKRIVVIAFNKKIQLEIADKIAKLKKSWVFASTFHAFGFKAWLFQNKSCKVNAKKIDNILAQSKDTIPEDYHQFVRRLVELAKQAVLGPMSAQNLWMDIVERHDLGTELNDDAEADLTPEKGIEHARAVRKRSNDLAKYEIDFSDMIYCPVFFKLRVLQHDWVLVDEAQDTNPARRMLAGMMTKPNGRMIWVGDRHQAIYGFTGADADSVDLIIRSYRATSLPLTVTYRCPKAVVTASQRYVSHITAADAAPEGEVINMGREDFDKDYSGLTATDAILCRNTAPLVKLAYKLLAKGIACHVEGRYIGANLIALMQKWKIKNTDKFLVRMENWERQQIERLLAKGKDTAAAAITDRCDTIRVLAEGCATVKCMIEKVQKMFGDHEYDDNAKNNLTLSTVHKSKGREWGNVYVLDFGKLMPSPYAKQVWQKEQENNLIYVAFTRAQEKLILVG